MALQWRRLSHLALSPSVRRVIVGVAFGGCVAGCSYTSPADRETRRTRAEREAEYRERFPIADVRSPVLIDGAIDDWPEDVYAIADDRWVYLRFRVEPTASGFQALQAAGETLEIRVDLDGNVLTGVGDGVMGVDLVIALSPPYADDPDGIGNGVALVAYDHQGRARSIGHDDAGFVFSPTYASEWYEARIDRELVRRSRPAASGGLVTDPGDAALGNGAGVGAVVYTQRDGDGAVVGAADPVRFVLPPLGDAERAQVLPPAKRGDVARFVSFNVLRSSPVTDPEPFARVLRALEPTVVMLQEWDDASASDIEAWFERHVGGQWHAATGAGRGVAIASRAPILAVYDKPIMAEGGRNPVRIATALVQTPLRSTLVSSVHLKCCGSANSEEDRLRIAEAEAIATALAGYDAGGLHEIVIGGDYNLVGTRAPLDLIGAQLDTDGGDLDPALPVVLADSTSYTWREANSRFSSGQLDWIVHSGASSEAVNAFVLDDDRLADEALEVIGIQRGDTSVSDHKPVVLDLRVKPIERN